MITQEVYDRRLNELMTEFKKWFLQAPVDTCNSDINWAYTTLEEQYSLLVNNPNTKIISYPDIGYLEIYSQPDDWCIGLDPIFDFIVKNSNTINEIIVVNYQNV